jgi:hypothetical protein
MEIHLYSPVRLHAVVLGEMDKCNVLPACFQGQAKFFTFSVKAKGKAIL